MSGLVENSRRRFLSCRVITTFSGVIHLSICSSNDAQNAILSLYGERPNIDESPRDKTNNVAVRPAKTQISLGIRPVLSESSLCA